MSVSRLGLGLAAIGRPGYINLGHAGDFGADHSWPAVVARGRDVLDAARDALTRAATRRDERDERTARLP